MKLKDAIISLVEDNGADVLKSPYLINILGDYNAFSEQPSSKNVLKNLQSEGYLNQILFYCENHSTDESVLTKIIYDMINRLGFRRESVIYVLESILHALRRNYFENGILSQNDNTNNFDTKVYSSERTTVENLKALHHLEFLGIPVDGDLNSFVNKLREKKLFQYIGQFEDNSGALFTGEYIGIKNCRIEVVKSQYSNVVFCICILLPELNDWFDLGVQYFTLKSKLEAKYGKPSYETETFHYLDGIEDYKKNNLDLLREEKVSYLSVFKADNGRISLSIEPICRVQLNYTDTSNEATHITARDSLI